MAFELQKQLEREPGPILDAIGLMLVGRAQSAFRDQGRGGVSWLPRSVPNRAGVLMDLKAGKKPSERRWDPRPAGIDTGETRASITHEVHGTRVEVGSNLNKATEIQEGATTTIALDRDLRGKLAAWLRSLTGAAKRGKKDARASKSERASKARQAFGPLFTLGALTVITPPRPFLMITDADRRDAFALARDFFFGRR